MLSTKDYWVIQIILRSQRYKVWQIFSLEIWPEKIFLVGLDFFGEKNIRKMSNPKERIIKLVIEKLPKLDRTKERVIKTNKNRNS